MRTRPSVAVVELTHTPPEQATVRVGIEASNENASFGNEFWR